jgi:hypothetical protein
VVAGQPVSMLTPLFFYLPPAAAISEIWRQCAGHEDNL